MTGPAPPVSEIRLASIVESSDDAILTKDAEGTITSWNPGAERMYGWSAEEAIGQKISILIPEDHAGEEWRILEQVLGGEAVDHYESDRLHRSGRRVRVSLSVSPLRDSSGEIVGASIIARDVTAQHRSRDFAARLHRLTAAFASEITREGAVRGAPRPVGGGPGCGRRRCRAAQRRRQSDRAGRERRLHGPWDPGLAAISARRRRADEHRGPYR